MYTVMSLKSGRVAKLFVICSICVHVLCCRAHTFLMFNLCVSVSPYAVCIMCCSACCIADTGEMVQRERDKTVELEFNRLLDSVSHLSHHLQVDQLGGEPLSLGQALELVIQ